MPSSYLLMAVTQEISDRIGAYDRARSRRQYPALKICIFVCSIAKRRADGRSGLAN